MRIRYIWKYLLYTVALAALFSGHARATPFLDGFEGASLNPFWTVQSEQHGTISLSSAQAYSGSQSVKLATLPEGGQRNVVLAHDYGQEMLGSISIWFYDGYPGQTTTYSHISFYNNNVGITGIGVQDWDSFYYHAGWGPREGMTTFQRTLGWHLFKGVFEDNATSMFIDGVLVASASVGYGVSSIDLNLTGPWGTAQYYFDDFSADVHPAGMVPEPASLALLGLGLVGLGFSRYKRAS